MKRAPPAFLQENSMRKNQIINENWIFRYYDGTEMPVNLPHTWNNIDGQDGGEDYKRLTCTYRKNFSYPGINADERLYLQFRGVNSSCRVVLNGKQVMTHDGGYSTFRADITEHLKDENDLVVEVDNSKNDRVYPQKADFTFYGGIYRDVELITVNKNHFDMDYYGGNGLCVSATPVNGYKDALINVKTWHNSDCGKVKVNIYDMENNIVASSEGTDVTVSVSDVSLWDGIKSPYLYTAVAELYVNGEAVDSVNCKFGVRDFYADPQKGFFLNGRAYPLRGVCRHQDRKGIGNAISREMHDEDMALICEIGANTVRLAHYQHDQYFYDLCDKYGMIVWAEIPYISEHMPAGRENTVSQMKELIVQNFNPPSIVTWGLSNEITISTKDKRDMLDNHRVLNDLCHEMDATRFTTLACYAVCGPFNKVAHISDVVSWNLYLGWYAPGLFLNDLWVDFFHAVYPHRCLGYSEYGAEGMTNLHSSHPRRGDHTEEYQAKYHEYLARFINKRPWMWATHIWNMFDFAADARDQGGEPGMNHKGLVTFDRQIKKDSFYLYKAWWSDAPFVHICSKRYEERTQKKTTVKVYSNCDNVTLFVNGKAVAGKKKDKVFTFRVKLDGEVTLEAVSGEQKDSAVIRRVKKPNPDYKLKKKKKGSANWT